MINLVCMQEHCILSHTAAGLLQVRKCAEGALLFVNGKPQSGLARMTLKHNDRVFFGNNHVFKVRRCM